MKDEGLDFANMVLSTSFQYVCHRDLQCGMLELVTALHINFNTTSSPPLPHELLNLKSSSYTTLCTFLYFPPELLK